MLAQIRPTRIDVTDRFPMVGFKILADRDTAQAEVAIAIDPNLFSAEGKKNRNTDNFYSTRGSNGLRLNGGEGGITIPPEILARFIGKDKIYFGLATGPQNGALKVDVMPSLSSPYINIRGLSNRSMSRVRVLPNRQQRAAGYGQQNQAQLIWAGDTPQPGMANISQAGSGNEMMNGKANGSAAPQQAPYDDGFGPMPEENAADKTAMPMMSSSKALSKAQSRSLAGPTPDYPETSRFVPTTAHYNGRSGKAIDMIVIHITDAPSTSSTVETFKTPGTRASAHYLVGQDGEIIQFVAEADGAWHAGPEDIDKRSIGIEHVAVKKGGVDYPLANGKKQHFDYLPPTEAQYCASAALVNYLCDKYGITADRTSILGHNEVNKSGMRSQDPIGAWDWDHYMDLVSNRYCNEQAVVAAEQGVLARNTYKKWSADSARTYC